MMINALFLTAFLPIVATYYSNESIVSTENQTWVETPGKDMKGTCTCVVETSWSEMREYIQLQDNRRRLDKMADVQKAMNFDLIYDSLENMTSRLNALEDFINEQAVATSVTELFDLRKAVEHLVGIVEQTNATTLSSGISDWLLEELEEIKNMTDAAWSRNPYQEKDRYEKNLSSLRNRLSGCQSNIEKTPFVGDELPTSLPKTEGWCENMENARFSRPLTHKFAVLGSDVPSAGSWFKDPLPKTDEERHRICTLSYEKKCERRYSRYDCNQVIVDKCFKNYTLFLNNVAASGMDIPTQKERGAVMYRNALFYFDGSLRKFNLTDKVLTTVTIGSQDVTYAGDSSTRGAPRLDLKVDEKGLWIIYSITSDHKIAISKIDPSTLVIKGTWITDIKKAEICAVFLICGRMFTVKTCNKNMSPYEENYVYDTHTSRGYHSKYHVASLYGQISELTYNPRERLVFGWDKGHMVTYPVTWPK